MPLLVVALLALQAAIAPPATLPPSASAKLRESLNAAKFATVPGWGTAAEGLAFVRMTHGFFLQALK